MVKHNEEGEEKEYGTKQYQYKNLNISIVAYRNQEEFKIIRKKSNIPLSHNQYRLYFIERHVVKI